MIDDIIDKKILLSRFSKVKNSRKKTLNRIKWVDILFSLIKIVRGWGVKYSFKIPRVVLKHNEAHH